MLVMGIDAGTSSCKVGVFSDKGLIASASCDYGAESRRPGYAEVDAEFAWLRIKETVGRVVSRPDVDARAVRAASFSSMGEAFVPVRLDGAATGPSILSYDSRGAAYSERLARDFGERKAFAICHDIIGPQFSLSKLMWIRDNEPELYGRTDKFLFWADFLAFKFGAEPFACDSLANRSLLFDAGAGDWSDAMLAWSGIDRGKLGRIARGGEIAGTVAPALADELGLSRDVLIVVGGHDQCANALGCGCIAAGSAVVGMGTYESYCPVFSWPENVDAFCDEAMNIENHVVDGLYVSFLYHHSGLLVDWFVRAFAADARPEAGTSVVEMLNREIPDRPSRILFLPYNEPPQWPRYIGGASGVFVGLKTDTTRGEMFRALLEGIAFYFVDAVRAMRSVGVCPESFLASGGGSRSDAWMQMRADVIGMPFTRLAANEGSLNGAAMLAAVRAGMFAGYSEAVAAYVGFERTFEPDSSRHAQYGEMLPLYRRLYPELGGLLSDLNGLEGF